MTNPKCQVCGHILALPSGLDILEQNCQVKVWCVKCGRRSIIRNTSVMTQEIKNPSIVEWYRRWR